MKTYIKSELFEQRLFNEKQTMKYLNISRATLLKVVESGKLPRIAISAKTKRYDVNDLDAYIENQRIVKP